MFPKVGGRGNGAGHVAVEGGVADGELGLIRVAGENAGNGGGEGGQNAGAAVAGLDVFAHERGHVDGLFFVAAGNGKGGDRFRRFVRRLSDGDGDVGSTEIFREHGRQIFCRLGIVACGRIDEEEIFGGEDGGEEGGIDGGIDPAGDADDDALDVNGFQKF